MVKQIVGFALILLSLMCVFSIIYVYASPMYKPYTDNSPSINSYPGTYYPKVYTFGPFSVEYFKEDNNTYGWIITSRSGPVLEPVLGH